MPVFQPPVVHDVPRVLPETRGVAFLLMRHYSNLPRGRTVIRIGGAYQTVDNPDQFTLDAATEVYLGGHIYVVSTEIASDLAEAGYEVTGSSWADLAAYSWGDLTAYTWDQLSGFPDIGGTNPEFGAGGFGDGQFGA